MPRVSVLRALLACIGAAALATLLIRAFGVPARKPKRPDGAISLDDVRAARAALRDHTLAGDFDAAASRYARDCIAVSEDGTFSTGRAAVRARMGRAARKGRFVRADVASESVSRTGGGAIESGTFAYEFAGASSTVASRGRFTAVWTRREGDWTIAYESCRRA